MEPSGMNKYIGVEIGGTKQQIGVGYGNGNIIVSRNVKLQYKRGAEDILDWLSENIRELLDEYSDVSRIGVGFGGPLESSAGRVLCSLQVPGWKDFQLKKWFEEEFHLPAVIVNDTVAGGIAELYCGAGIGSKSMFYTNIGTGIGGGLYIDGKNYDGIGFGAGYLGNSLIPDWQSSTPGAMTRLELICSGRSIETRLNQPGYVPEGSSLCKKGERITCQDLGDGVKAEDTFCMEELDRIASSFSIGLANVLALGGIQKILIGGGVAKMGEVLFSRIRRFTKEYAFVANQGTYVIQPCRLMDEAVIVGALLAADGKWR